MWYKMIWKIFSLLKQINSSKLYSYTKYDRLDFCLDIAVKVVSYPGDYRDKWGGSTDEIKKNRPRLVPEVINWELFKV